MSKIKSVLSLLAIFCAYGVAGRMDYDDAVMLEAARNRSATSNCPNETAAASARPIGPETVDSYDDTESR